MGERVREVFPRKGQPYGSEKTQSLSLWLSQLSALYEISLAKEFHDAGVPQLKHVYMGQRTAGKLFKMLDADSPVAQVFTFTAVRR